MNNRTWKKYLELPASEEMDSTGAAVFIDDAIKHLPQDAGSVLCIGCGDGYELSKIKNAEGTNLNPMQAKAVQAKGFQCYCADMHELPFKDKSYDTVFSRDSFEHALSPFIAISEFSRIARKYVLIVVPNETWQFSGWHYICPTPIQMLALGFKVGLKLVDAWRCSFNNGYLFIPARIDDTFKNELKQLVEQNFGIQIASI